jgi:hypothetical protein
MKIDTPTITLAEAAYLLRAQLGPMRSWSDFLADNIRGKQSVAGHTLLPCARKRDGKSFRPVYSVHDVKTFIAKVLASVSGAGKAAIKQTVLPVDTGRHWKVNRFDQDGSPIADLRRITTHSTSAYGY